MFYKFKNIQIKIKKFKSTNNKIMKFFKFPLNKKINSLILLIFFFNLYGNLILIIILLLLFHLLNLNYDVASFFILKV